MEFKHNRFVNSVAFSPDGKMLASGSGDHTMKLWSIDSMLLKEFKHDGCVLSVSFSTEYLA